MLPKVFTFLTIWLRKKLSRKIPRKKFYSSLKKSEVQKVYGENKKKCQSLIRFENLGKSESEFNMYVRNLPKY